MNLVRRMARLGSCTALVSGMLAPFTALAATPLDRCIAEKQLPRVTRVLDANSRARYAAVASERDGIPTAVVLLGPADLTLGEALAQAAAAGQDGAGDPWPIDDPARICSPVDLPRSRIDAEDAVVAAVGLNYAAHAEEAGGGDVFLFPKPAAPAGAYQPVPNHDGVTLLDYEVELGFVLLRDVSLTDLPDREALLHSVAFFIANDISDREPIIAQKAAFGPGTGFVEGKGRPGYLPAGPWLVRGTEVFAALEACGADGLGIRLDVDEGEGFVSRQSSTTARMILDPLELLERIAAQVEDLGLRTEMPVTRDGRVRFYPLAVDEESPRLPAGSVVLTGTPDGVALQAPAPFPLILRGLARLRGPFEQFRLEEIDRARNKAPGGYLSPGDVVRAGIDGLGTQLFSIAATADPPDPCVKAASPRLP